MKTLCIYSGGLDSTTLLYYLRHKGHDVSCVSFYYGQRHRKELEAAESICAELEVLHRIVTIPDVFGGSALLEGDTADIPHGHYEAESMKTTVVSGRNLVFAAIAYAMSQSLDCDAIALGVHSGDHAIYHDCRPVFCDCLRQTIALAGEKTISLLTPFLHQDKSSIVAQARELGVPIEKTWTCYEGGAEPCGLCGACVERAESLIVWKKT